MIEELLLNNDHICTIDLPIENGEVSIAMLNCQRVLSPTPKLLDWLVI